jgi:UDP-3-O-[3-hydroxymyristoyl] N-acetylglucosamine deacetylase
MVKPGLVDSGIVFYRTDLDVRKPIQAEPGNVRSTDLATTLGNDNIEIHTVEHLLSALLGLGIDNAQVEVNGPELPIMDGSAGPFVEALLSAGRRPQNRSKRCVIIKKKIRVSDRSGRWAEAIPSRKFKVTCSIDYDHPLINEQRYRLEFKDAVYVKEICKARTFGFLREVEGIRARGLAKGGSLDNAVVIDDFNILNEGGLRYPDEFVRHKVLDTMGDIATMGGMIVGHIRSYKGGHSLNRMLVQALMSTKNALEVVDAAELERSSDGLVELPEWSDCRALLAEA